MSEVCRTLGVTRRTLQEYDRIGLLSPSAKTDAGYWMYDDEAIEKLYLIQIFVRVGYKRKDIARLIANPTLDLMEEYQKAINILMEQRKEINGMINMLRVNMMVPQLTSKKFKSLSKLNIEDCLRNKSLKEEMNKTIDALKNVDGLEETKTQPFVALGIMIAGIAFFRKYDISSDEVQSYVADLYDFIIEIIAMDEESSETDEEFIVEAKANSEMISETCAEIVAMLNDPEYEKNMDMYYGKGTTKFASDAIRYFVTQRGGIIDE